ncbi:Spore protein SP21 [compost metagenome]
MRALTPWGRRHMSSPDLFNQFEEFINDFDRGIFPMSLTSRMGMADFSPAVDLEEKDGNYLVSADLPGLKKEDIKIDLSDNVLTISGERVREEKSEGKYTERVYGKFTRSFSLPTKVNADKIQAQFKDGVLHVTLPKAEGVRSQAIKIQ